MKRHFSWYVTVTAALALCFACFVACSDDVSGGGSKPGVFTKAAVVTLTAGDKQLKVEWVASVPKADSYDIYCYEGNTKTKSTIKGKDGKKVLNQKSGAVIKNLKNGTTYSVLVTANKSNTTSIDSTVAQLAPNASGGNNNNNNNNNNQGEGGALELTVSVGSGGLICAWTPSDPPADSYDLYYYPEGGLSAAILKGGTKVPNVTSPYTLTDLTNGSTYSVIITANVGSTKVDSAVMEGRPNAQNKRGVGYDFATARVGSKNYTFNTGWEMDLLMSGLHGIKWFYAWGVQPNQAVVSAMASRNLAYFPMVWNNNWQENVVRGAVNSIQPRPEYILAFNEPNFRNQSNMTPQQAAAAWPRLKAIADELNLKIVSPAMNFSPNPPYQDPTKWLDEFFAIIPTSEVAAISIHSYAAWASALKSHVEGYKKYGLPIWVTEFSAWEDNANPTGSTLDTWQKQNEYLSQAVTYLEMDPDVERYAWYLPKGHMADNVAPMHNLLTDVQANNATQSQLTPLGIIYTNLSTCDKSVWIPAGQKIDASQYTSCNLADDIGVNGKFSGIALSRPVTDTDKSAGVLEIYNFSTGKWVEYQVDLPQAKNYTLSVRCSTSAPTGLYVSVNDNQKKNKILNSATAWVTETIDLGAFEAGKHTIRLQISQGSCALNWLQMD